MANLNFNSGLKEFTINGKSTFRFNPNDPGLGGRFNELLTAMETMGSKIEIAGKNLADKSNPDKWGTPQSSRDLIQLLTELDKEVNKLLQYVFGESNDFDAIFEGVNVFAGTDTGEWVITNFLDAIRPQLEGVVEERLKVKAAAAHRNREQRRAAQRR